MCRVLLLLTVPSLFAQLDRASLTGTVTDATGSAVPSVKVVIIQSGTRARFETTTNDAGQYTRPNLAIGAYQISFEANGFRKSTRADLTLKIAEVLRVDAQLELGSTSESVEVRSELPRVQADTPQIGTSLGAKSLTNLPLSFSGGRQAENFAYAIVPGVSGDTFRGRVNGSTDFAYETLVDGASVTVNQGGNFSPMSVSVEALAEVKIQTGGMSAEFGRSQGGVFNYVMKSGTNALHGSAYTGIRNEALNANTFANNARGVDRPQDRKMNWAGSIGGPIVIPKLYNGRNKTFFYFSYEQYRERNYGFSAPNRNAPLAEFYQGDFSRLLGPATTFRDALDRPITRGAIYDPASFRQLASGRWIGDIFPGNRIPASRISTVAQRVNSIAVKHYLPTIKGPDGLVPLVNNQVFPISGNPELDQYQYSGKGDHIFNERHKISGSYNLKEAPRLILDAGGLWDTREIYGGPLAKTRRRPDDGWLARGAWDWTVSPSVLNNLTLSFNRRGNPERILEADRDGAKELGIRGLTSLGYPNINWGGGPFVSLESPGFQNVSFRADNGWGILDSVSFSRGKHFLKVGVDFRHNQQNRRQTPSSSFNFSARGTAIPNEAFSANQTGYAFASYLLGIVDSASLSDPVGLGGRRNYMALYFHDDYKITSNLTLNLGLRWEYQPPVYEVKDRLSSWNPAKLDPESGLPGAYDFAGTCQQCTGSRSFGRRSLKDFGPRLGFAWRLKKAWTLRGAYGIMYEGDSPNGYNAVPLGKATSVAWGGTYLLASDPVRPWAGIFNWDNGFPNDRFQPAGYDVSWGNRQRPGMIDANYGQTPYIQNFTLNLQRGLGKYVLDLGYVGNKATRLRFGELQRINQLPPSVLSQYGTRLNNQVRNAAEAASNGIPYPYSGFVGTVASALRPYPQLQGNQTVQVYGAPLGFSTYHALQVVVNREFANGLTLYSNYVFSKQMTNTESSLIGDNDSKPLDYYNLKLEKMIGQNDRTHAFKTYLSYDLPFARGPFARVKGWTKRLLGGWNIASIVNYASGEPLEFTGSSPLSGGWNGAVNRLNVAAGPLKADGFNRNNFELSSALSPGNRYLNRAAFSDPALIPLTLGTGAYRYSQVRGFGNISENLTLTKSVALTEKVRFQLRAEFFNLFNRHQLGGITTGINNPNFGQVTSVSGSRQAQISGRLDF